MQNARRKMIEYVKSKGIDITSEFTYKESNTLANKPIFGLPRDHFKSSPMDTVGLIPMSWWCYRMTDKELLKHLLKSTVKAHSEKKRLTIFSMAICTARILLKRITPIG